MKLQNSGTRMVRGTAIAIAAAGLALPAAAQTANTTTANTNVLNLLSPFLSLNSTSVGQATLQQSLSASAYDNYLESTLPITASVSISDKTVFGGASTAITLVGGTLAYYGPGANIAGGLPAQAIQGSGTITPLQVNGGLGGLGAAFQAAVSPGGAAVPSVVTLLTNAYNFTAVDSRVAQYYFANGTINGTTAAVAASGTSLPTAFGYPNLHTSVYDTAYNVSNSTAGQNIYGNSSPAQILPYIPYDPTAGNGMANVPAYPSNPTVYAATDGILIAMMAPQFYQNMMLRASEIANAPIVLGWSTPIDAAASRAMAFYDVAQLLNGNNAAYTQTNAVSGATSQNLAGQFTTAASALTSYLQTQTASCGGSLTACAANNNYGTYSTTTYGQAFALKPGFTINAAEMYQLRQSYALPGGIPVEYVPGELGPVGGGTDASILLSTLYGGSSATAQALAASVGGPLYANLATATINQIIANTESPALTAFYGTALSYWTRINLYDAAGYFQNLVGTINLAAGDVVNTAVTVASTGVLGGTGTINGSVTFQSGGALGVTSLGTSYATPLTVNGAVAFQSGSDVLVTGAVLPGATGQVLTAGSGYSVSGLTGLPVVYQVGSTVTPFLAGVLTSNSSGLSLTTSSNFVGGAKTLGAVTQNETAVATALDRVANAGLHSSTSIAFFNQLQSFATAANGLATLDSLSGEGIAALQQMGLEAESQFADTVLLPTDHVPTQRRIWGRGFGQATAFGGLAGAADANGSIGGFAAGFDAPVTPGVALGVAAGYSHIDSSVNDRATTMGADGGHLGIYGLAGSGPWTASGLVAYTHYDNTERRTALGAGQSGRFASDSVLARAEGGYEAQLAGATVRPFLSLQIASLTTAAFTESGGSAALALSRRTADSEQLSIGASIAKAVTLSNGMELTPWLRLAYVHEFDAARGLTASLVALPGSSFDVTSASVPENAMVADLGASLGLTEQVALYATFTGKVANGAKNYGGLGGVKFSW